MAKNFTTSRELLSLKVGDVIRHKVSAVGDGWLVVYHDGDALVVQRTLTATNPDEWEAVVINGRRV